MCNCGGLEKVKKVCGGLTSLSSVAQAIEALAPITHNELRITHYEFITPRPPTNN